MSSIFKLLYFECFINISLKCRCINIRLKILLQIEFHSMWLSIKCISPCFCNFWHSSPMSALSYTYPPSLFPQFFEPSPLKSDDVLFGRAHRCVPFQPFFRFNCSHKNDENRLMSFLKMFAHSFQFQMYPFSLFLYTVNNYSPLIGTL